MVGIAILLLLSTSLGAAQEPIPASPQQPASGAADPAAVPEKVGGEVSPPKLISMSNPTFTKEERKHRINGVVEVYCIVTADGRAARVHVVKTELSDSLAKTAVETVKKYRFQPAMKDGKPVPVELYVDVHINVY